MPKNHLIFVVMLVLSSSRSFALDVGTEASPLVASGIDFIFEGGSIEFQFGNADGTKLVLVLVNPKSPFANRIKHPNRILATRGSRFDANEAESLSKENLEQVLKIMIASTDKARLHPARLIELLIQPVVVREYRWTVMKCYG